MTKVFIIAEAGVNHNGSLEIARRMVDAAVDANADAIKFQTFKAEEVLLTLPIANPTLGRMVIIALTTPPLSVSSLM